MLWPLCLSTSRLRRFAGWILSKKINSYFLLFANGRKEAEGRSRYFC